MHVPGLMQRVRLTALDEVYLVIRVDHGEQVAGLLPLKYGMQTIRSVPFLALEAIQGWGPPRLKPDAHETA